jgi:hypothetical protein
MLSISAWQPDGLRTTAQIAVTLVAPGQRRWNHCVALAGPLDLPPVDLPLAPYTLGVWLGDGDSDAPRITVGGGDWELLDHLEADGAVIDHISEKRGTENVRVKLGANAQRGSNRAASVRARLSALGVLNNKHIPLLYLRASRSQRMALLQGLLDTDGTIAAGRGRIEYSSSSPSLASGVMELLYSLGFKPNNRTYLPHKGRRSTRLDFIAYADTPVFRLQRKRERQVQRPSGLAFSGSRRIVSCERIPSVPVKCIKVAAPSGMFLAGEGMIPTHNSPDWAECVMLLFAVRHTPSRTLYTW